jgi:hypothetical protein
MDPRIVAWAETNIPFPASCKGWNGPVWNQAGARRLNGKVRRGQDIMIRKLQSGEYRLYSRKVNPKTGKRRNLGTFKSRAAAEKHERAVQYFKRH